MKGSQLRLINNLIVFWGQHDTSIFYLVVKNNIILTVCLGIQSWYLPKYRDQNQLLKLCRDCCLQYINSYLIYLLMQMKDGTYRASPYTADNPFKLPLKLKASNLYPYPINSPSTKTITYDAQQPFKPTFWKFNENHSKSNHYLKLSEKLERSSFEKHLKIDSFNKNAGGSSRVDQPKRINQTYEITNPFYRKNLYLPKDNSFDYQYERNIGSYSNYYRYYNEPAIKPYSSPDKQAESSYRSSKRRGNRDSEGFNDSIVLNLLNPIQSKKSSYTPLQIFKPYLEHKESRKGESSGPGPHNHKKNQPKKIKIRGVEYHLANVYPVG